MAEELQSLLNKINQDGVKKAEAEGARIVEEAEKKAAAIVKAAQQRAVQIGKDAERDAASLRQRAESAVEQASRDVLLQLKNELTKRLRTVVSQASDAALTPEFMAGVIAQLVTAFGASPDAEITVMSAVKDVEALEKALSGSLKASFKKQPEVFPDMELKGGCKVNISGSDVYYDLSDEAITDLVAEFVGPKLAAMLQK